MVFANGCQVLYSTSSVVTSITSIWSRGGIREAAEELEDDELEEMEEDDGLMEFD